MTDDSITPHEYVEENRDELMEILLYGDKVLRAFAIAILYEGGEQADIETVKRELELYEQLDETTRDQLRK